MIYIKIMEVLKADAEQLSHRATNDLMERSEMTNLRKIPENVMYHRVFDVFSTLGYWLDRARSKKEIEEHFTGMGNERCREGIPGSEVVMFLMLIKRHLWLYLLDKHFFETSYELMKSLEMNNRIVLFFDRAILAVIREYERESRKG
jgi:hypothetical protein